MLSNQQVTDEMLRYLRSTNDPMLNAAADALSKLAEVERERDALRVKLVEARLAGTADERPFVDGKRMRPQ